VEPAVGGAAGGNGMGMESCGNLALLQLIVPGSGLSGAKRVILEGYFWGKEYVPKGSYGRVLWGSYGSINPPTRGSTTLKG
jgi:hypothetical protein